MNQKDYKEIAGIIKLYLSDREAVDKQIKSFLVEKLADYFEREDKVCSNCKTPNMILIKNLPEGLRYKCNGCLFFHKLKFNKKQFLKDCGVN